MVSWKTKGLVYVTLVRSVFLAGAGTWSTQADQAAIQAWEAALLRNLSRTGIIQHVSLEEMRRKLGSRHR